MLQKENIIIALDKPKHIRQIAAELKLVPSTVLRILKKMQKSNIVDSFQDGRNTKYFLKDTPEAKINQYISEYFRLENVIKNPLIRRIYNELLSLTNNELIVLFGSYANETHNKNSDVDVYIETNDSNLVRKLSGISSRLSIKSGILRKDSELAREIVNNHIIIQNVERFYSLLK